MTAHSIKLTASLPWQPLKSGIAVYNHAPADQGMRIEVGTGKRSKILADGRSTLTGSSSTEERRLALRGHGICATQKVLHRVSLCSPRRCEGSWRGTNPHCILSVLIIQRYRVQRASELQHDRYCRVSPCQHALEQCKPAWLRGRRPPLPPGLPPSKGERGAAPVSAPLPGGMPPPDPMDLLQRAPVTGSQQMMAAPPEMPSS